MTRYLRRTFLFLLPLIALMGAFELALRRIPNDYSFTSERLREHGDSIDVLILGNSHGFNGINPEGLGSQGYNAASIGQDHQRDRAIMRHFAHHLPSLQHVIIPVSYFSIGSRIEQGREPWRVKNYVIHMGMRDEATLLEHRFELLNHPKPKLIRMLLDHWLNGEDNRSCGDYGGGINRPKPGLDMHADARATVERHSCDDPARYWWNMEHLKAIIAIASEHGAQVHLVFPPMHPAYLEIADTSQLQFARAIGRQLAQRHETVSYHDLSADSRFTDADFSNSDHLGATGRRKFTMILADTLGL